MSYFGVAPIASTDNMTTTPLGSGATYTGTWEIAPRSMVLVQSYADSAGTLYYDFSIDGVNADSTFPVSGFSTLANIPTVQPSAVGGRYFRVRYINGSVAQTEFRLGAFWGDSTNFYAPMNQAYNLNSAAILTRAPWTWLDVARGLTNGLITVKKFGRNESVGTTYEPISIGGIYRTPQAAGATTVRIKSGGNANDTAAGSGAREITIEGLDENFAVATEAIATAGASASSSSTTTFTRIYRAYVSASGTYATVSSASHAGTIIIENTAGTEDWAYIDSTDFPNSQSEIADFSIPAGSTGFVKMRNVTVDSGKTINLIFFARTNIDQTAAPYDALRVQSIVTGISGGSIETFGEVAVPFGPYTGPTDVGFLAKTSTGTAAVSVEFEIFLINE